MHQLCLTLQKHVWNPRLPIYNWRTFWIFFDCSKFGQGCVAHILPCLLKTWAVFRYERRTYGKESIARPMVTDITCWGTPNHYSFDLEVWFWPVHTGRFSRFLFRKLNCTGPSVDGNWKRCIEAPFLQLSSLTGQRHFDVQLCKALKQMGNNLPKLFSIILPKC